ncbi:dATP/dGTP pyrophosphohydrolase domain-containing protein [Aureimonas sp. Leaf454]|uniref:dATP/dGTP pyrophosphohydrolase domain-containing protein n=1 Tax=Aureimonas sp. Leaf454 TaxID=1736381 RepID=UPI000AFB1937|nr:dATP/dGTP pyrophosphohydrolase domain-containing protein [Aureimonas sp. Leaf454]
MSAALDAVTWARDYARSMAEQVRGGKRGTSAEFFIAKADGLDKAIAALKPTAAPASGDGGGDLVAYIQRQWAWSRETFGPALRTKGVIDHIRKELGEIEREPHDLSEWVDVIILAMDGFWRHGGKPEDLLPRMQAKQDKNFARQWPDWRTMSEDSAIEHDRSEETVAYRCASCGASDPARFVRCLRQDCPDGRDQARSRAKSDGDQTERRT